MPRWSEVSVNLAEVKKDAQVIEGGGGAAHHLHLVSHKNLGQYQSGARCRPRWLKVEVEPPTISTW